MSIGFAPATQVQASYWSQQENDIDTESEYIILILLTEPHI